jgi:hypothetical protein
MVRRGGRNLEVVEILQGRPLPIPDHVQRQVDGCAVQIARGVLKDVRRATTLQQLDKNPLQHVLRILTIAGDRVGRAIHQLAVLQVQVFEFL